MVLPLQKDLHVWWMNWGLRLWEETAIFSNIAFHLIDSLKAILQIMRWPEVEVTTYIYSSTVLSCNVDVMALYLNTSIDICSYCYFLDSDLTFNVRSIRLLSAVNFVGAHTHKSTEPCYPSMNLSGKNIFNFGGFSLISQQCDKHLPWQRVLAYILLLIFV